MVGNLWFYFQVYCSVISLIQTRKNEYYPYRSLKCDTESNVFSLKKSRRNEIPMSSQLLLFYFTFQFVFFPLNYLF